MLQASYIVGGHSFSAAEIEFVILKMKPPAHRPQLVCNKRNIYCLFLYLSTSITTKSAFFFQGLLLAVHRFKISEEHRKYSIDRLEPLLLFALSSGMYSSPAVSFLI